MTEKPITPGPWGVHRRMKDCVTFTGRHGEENLFLQNVDGYFACQSPADARLISAAPELLAALERCELLLRTKRHACEDNNLCHLLDSHISQARAAIAKATE